LTLFQQVGGTVGLALTGTIFGSKLIEEIPAQMIAAGVPQEVVGGFLTSGGAALQNLSGTNDLGAALRAAGGEQIAPFVDAMVVGIHQAFSIATSTTFVLGIGASLVAALLVFFGLPGGRMGESPAVEKGEPAPAS
ncbi:MAG TPA: hypothetical protein VL687_08530, partial [Methylomirabilota bacterium]|nr:hypothetical protein [Methylomirabilota bacterium]